MEDELKRQYDTTPYCDQSFVDLDLGRLLGLASLFKLGPKQSATPDLRVLDLACASGQHIRRQAERFGVDLLQAQEVTGLRSHNNYHCVGTTDGSEYEVWPS